MKIGILTFHRAHNYGAVLQAYALKTFLVGLGHDVKLIDYTKETAEVSYSKNPRQITISLSGEILQEKWDSSTGIESIKDFEIITLSRTQ
jgi:hypothetical protein